MNEFVSPGLVFLPWRVLKQRALAEAMASFVNLERPVVTHTLEVVVVVETSRLKPARLHLTHMSNHV